MKAFPHTKLERGADGRTWDTSEVRYEGMDLRDYFAAKAMQGMLTNQPLRADIMLDGDSLAQSSYQIADAMMKAREK